jgi:hypothetical protein
VLNRYPARRGSRFEGNAAMPSALTQIVNADGLWQK